MGGSEEGMWILPGILARDSVTVLASAPKAGKTCVATAMARAVATGGSFGGIPASQRGVLWCAHEETPDARGALQAGLTMDDPFWVGYGPELPTLCGPEPGRDRFGRYREETPTYVFEDAISLGAGLIVVDSLHAAVERGSLADNHFARRTVGRLKRLAFHYHVAVLVLHHLTKSGTRGTGADRFADSAQILAAADAHFFLERRDGKVTLTGRGRHPSPLARLELATSGVLDYRPWGSGDGEVTGPSDMGRVRAAWLASPGASAGEISAATGVRSDRVRTYLSRFRREST